MSNFDEILHNALVPSVTNLIIYVLISDLKIYCNPITDFNKLVFTKYIYIRKK